MPDDRIAEMEKALADPNVTKFAPKGRMELPLASFIAQVREQAQATLKLCDEMSKIVDLTEADVRKLGDTLVTMSGRIK